MKARAARAARSATSPRPAGPVTSGTRLRRACLAASRAVDRHRADGPFAALPFPPGHAALRRPRDDHVHPGLGHQLDGQLPPLPLRDRLDDGQGRIRGGHHRPVPHRELQLAALGPRHHALGHLTLAIGQVHPLTRRQPAHVGRVPSLRPGQHDQVAGQVRGAGEEDRRLGAGSGRRVTGR